MRPILAPGLLLLLLLPATAPPVHAHDTWTATFWVGTSTNASAPLIHVVLRIGDVNADGFHPGQIEIYPMTPPFTTTIHPVRVWFHNLADASEGGPILDVNDEDATIQLLGAQTRDDALAQMVLAGRLAEFGDVTLAGFVGEP